MRGGVVGHKSASFYCKIRNEELGIRNFGEASLPSIISFAKLYNNGVAPTFRISNFEFRILVNLWHLPSGKLSCYTEYILNILAYRPSLATNSSWLPLSAMPSFVTTSIVSAFLIVVNLWATVSVVLPFASLSKDC